MTIPFRVKRLTDTAKLPSRDCEGDLWDIYADDFCSDYLKDIEQGEGMYDYDITHQENLHFETHLECFDRNHLPSGFPDECKLYPKGRILVKTGVSVNLPFLNDSDIWCFNSYDVDFVDIVNKKAYAVADIRPRSGLALKHGLTVLNSPGTIDNSYRKEIGVILYNAGHEPYTIKKGEKIAQMLIRPLYPSKMEEVKEVEDTGRGGFGSTGY